jgi:type VI protein secretion system component Hcp
MRTLLFILLLVPELCFSQTSYVFIKLTDPKGIQIKGDATTKGFERTIRAFTTSSSGKNNTQFTFTMPVTDAGAILKSAMNSGELLLNAKVSVMTVNGITGVLQPSYTITMEGIRVTACSESMGCNAQMTTGVSLVATRIGWTYYSADKAGTNVVVSQKYGFDSETGLPWNNF